MRDLRKVREESQLRLTYSQFFALLGLMAVSLLLSGLLGYYFGRGATAAEQAALASVDAPLIPEDVETESVATLLALARERRRDDEERLTLDYDELLPKSDQGVPQALRKPAAAAPPAIEPPPPREVAPQELVSDETGEEGGQAEAEPVAAAAEAPEPERQPDAAAAASTGRFTIQVSSFLEPDQADGLVSELKRKGFEAHRVSAEVNGRVWHRVRVGAFDSREEAAAEQERLSLIRSDLRPMVTFQ